MPIKNVAIIGSNFGISGYLPALKKNKNYKIVLICCRSDESLTKLKKKFTKIKISKNWKDAFNKNIDLIICSTIPKVQDKIINYNFKIKKSIIFEKPISSSYQKSLLILKKLIKYKIKSEINLTFLYHNLFISLKKIIDSNKLGKIKKISIDWSLKNNSLLKKTYSWKIDSKQGGGIKNIYLIHILTYCYFLFNNFKIINKKLKTIKILNKKIITHVNLRIQTNEKAKGSIKLNCLGKKHQVHKIKILFSEGSAILTNDSKHWTKNFKLTIYNNRQKKIMLDNNYYYDGRSKQISNLLKNFIKDNNFINLERCVNAEKLIGKI
jgi:predicted dehydrogenase